MFRSEESEDGADLGSFIIDYYFNWAQFMKFVLISDEQEVGEHNVLLGAVLAAENSIYENVWMYRAEGKGKIIVKSEPVQNDNTDVSFTPSVQALPTKAFMGCCGSDCP